MMKNKKRIVMVICGVVLIGIICAIFLIPTLDFDTSSVSVGSQLDSQSDFHALLLEYADYGLTYEADTKTFYYDGQLVKKIVDSAYTHTNSDGTVQVAVSRDSNGKITGLKVK